MGNIIYGETVKKELEQMGIYREIVGDKQAIKEELQEQILREMDRDYRFSREYAIQSLAPVTVDKITGKIGFKS